MTAERFVTYNPDSGPSERIYRTGDRARMLPNGELLFLGRLDEQVKIRGYRVELGEIVACLDRCPGIESSAVLARTSDSGPFLVAYLVTAPSARLTATDLREFLATRLPDYMVPAQFVSIPTMPMTSNGKLDKSALPSPTAETLLPSRTAETNHVPTLDGVGETCLPQVAGLVAALVGQPTVAPEENFFMLGGHSLLGVQLVARIKDMFGVKLTLRQLFKAPTVAELATEVARLVGEKK
jgi:acyl carrier protein